MVTPPGDHMGSLQEVMESQSHTTGDERRRTLWKRLLNLNLRAMRLAATWQCCGDTTRRDTTYLRGKL